MSGVPQALFDFAAISLLGVLAFNSLNHWNHVKKHDELRHPPYDSKTMSTILFVTTIGMASFFYNFIIWLPTFAASGSQLLGVLGILDIIVTALLFTAAGLLPRIVPTSKSGCGNAKDWGVPDGTPSLFAIATDSQKSDDINGTCNSFYTLFALAVAMGVLYTISGLLNLLLGFGCAYDNYGYNTRRSASRPKRSCWSYIVAIPCVMLRIQIFIMSIPLRSLYFFLPRSAQSTWTYWRRWISKYASSFKSRIWTSRRNAAFDANERDLKSVVMIELVPHSRNDHYRDVLIRSAAEKRKDKSDIPLEKREEMLEDLRVSTCQPGQKSSCQGCESQICPDCSKQRRLQLLGISSHISNCHPLCSGCYKSRLYTRQRQTWNVEACYCQHSYIQNLPFDFCRSCAVADDSTLEKLVWNRSVAEIRQLERQPLSCRDCRALLPDRGPRWWACGKCGRECKEGGAHAAWAWKGKG